jgi:hypothetical protein
LDGWTVIQLNSRNLSPAGGVRSADPYMAGGARKIIGSFKVATYLILIFYLTGFYCQIKISNLIGVFKFAIYSYLIDYLL